MFMKGWDSALCPNSFNWGMEKLSTAPCLLKKWFYVELREISFKKRCTKLQKIWAYGNLGHFL